MGGRGSNEPQGGVSNCGVSVVGKDVSHSIKQDALQRKVQQAFREEERARHRVLEEEERHADMVAKTRHLRELRLAREAAERKASEAAAKAKRIEWGLDAPDTWDAKSIEAVNRALRRTREQRGK